MRKYKHIKPASLRTLVFKIDHLGYKFKNISNLPNENRHNLFLLINYSSFLHEIPSMQLLLESQTFAISPIAFSF